MAHVPEVPDFSQYNFQIGDTDAAIVKQNGQNAALVKFGNELRKTTTSFNDDLLQVGQDKASAEQAAAAAQAYRDQTQEISESGLPLKAGNGGKVLKVSDDEQRYELGQLEQMLESMFRRMVPAGMVAGFPRTSAPSGWLKCNGAAVSRSVYADLFAAIGTTFGPGNGSTTFNLPDYRGEFPRWLDDGRGIDSGRGISQRQGDQNKAHDHGGRTSNDTHGHSASTNNAGSHSHSGSANNGGAHAHAVELGTSNAGGSYQYPKVEVSNLGPSAVDTASAGNHSHSLSINAAGSHSHSVYVSNDTHNHAVSIDGGGESRPRNMPLLACIRF